MQASTAMGNLTSAIGFEHSGHAGCRARRRPQGRLGRGLRPAHRAVLAAALFAHRPQPAGPSRRRRHHPGSLHQGLPLHPQLPWRVQPAHLALPHRPARGLEPAPLVVPAQAPGVHHRHPPWAPQTTTTARNPPVSAPRFQMVAAPPTTTPRMPRSNSASKPACENCPTPSAPSSSCARWTASPMTRLPRSFRCLPARLKAASSAAAPPSSSSCSTTVSTSS